MKGILFSAPMVLAILEGRKTQTRRLLTPQPTLPAGDAFTPDLYRGNVAQEWAFWRGRVMSETRTWIAQYKPHETLAVREAWRTLDCYDHMTPKDIADLYDNRPPDYLGTAPLLYLADNRQNARGALSMSGTQGVYKWGRYRHARFMPCAFARLHIRIAAVRIERLRNISADDARAEGIEAHGDGWKDYFADKDNRPIAGFITPIASYASLWESINGPGSWDANPWVCVYTFAEVKL